jgi:hypothetical protein
MRKKKTSFFWILLGLAGVLVLAGCTVQPAAAPPAGKTLQFIEFFSPL